MSTITVFYNNEFYVDEIVQSAEWSGDVNQAYRTLTLTLLNTIDGSKPIMTFELGKEIRFYSDGVELFRGFIFRRNIDQTGMLTLTVYDENVYLTKNMDTKKFVKKTASQIIRQLCTEFEIAVGTIADTKYVIPKLILRDMTLWDMMTTALTETRNHKGGGRFFLYAKEGKLHLAERKERKAAYMIESSTNLTTASYSQSIDELRNQVRVVGGDPDKKPIIEVARNNTSAERYGLMQHLENGDVDATRAQIKQLAEQRLAELNVIDDEATITAIGYDDTYAGVSVYVYDDMTSIIGSYYVSSDTHTYSNGTHTMALTLSATDDLPTLKYEPPHEPEKKTKKKKKASADSGKYWEDW